MPFLFTAALACICLCAAFSAGAQTLAEPQMAGTLEGNPRPASLESEALGKLYLSGALSGLALAQTKPAPGDRPQHLDIGNAQAIVQKPDGLARFYAQAGVYSIPVIGLPYVHATQETSDLYGPVPVAYAMLAPSEALSIKAGKLPTLIGPEPTFTYQNMNIPRALLWNQEPAISRGVQADYAAGPLAFSLSLNDGFYSGHYNWLVGAASWAIDAESSVMVLASGSTSTTTANSVATPVAFNNGRIYNVAYSRASAGWKVTAYLQAVDVPANAALGFASGAQSYGGAVLVSYRFSGAFSLAGRGELVTSNGSAASGAPDLLYGPGSRAWTLTVTPTWQEGRVFARLEPSYTQARRFAPGRAFGTDGNASTQARLMLESGVLF